VGEREGGIETKGIHAFLSDHPTNKMDTHRPSGMTAWDAPEDVNTHDDVLFYPDAQDPIPDDL
jgi:hypothetical protein